MAVTLTDEAAIILATQIFNVLHAKDPKMTLGNPYTFHALQITCLKLAGALKGQAGIELREQIALLELPK